MWAFARKGWKRRRGRTPFRVLLLLTRLRPSWGRCGHLHNFPLRTAGVGLGIGLSNNPASHRTAMDNALLSHFKFLCISNWFMKQLRRSMVWYSRNLCGIARAEVPHGHHGLQPATLGRVWAADLPLSPAVGGFAAGCPLFLTSSFLLSQWRFRAC